MWCWCLCRIQSKGKSDEHEAKFLRFKHRMYILYTLQEHEANIDI